MSKLENVILKEHIMWIKNKENPTKSYTQKGIFRTNCLDCLDRTNVIQARISLVVLKYVLDKIKEKELKSSNMSQANAEKCGFG